MQPTPTLQLILAFAVLALVIYAFGDSASPAWWWAILIGAALAAVVLAGGWSERGRMRSEPLTAKLGAFVVSELVLPVLVLAAAAVAWITGGANWLDAAAVLVTALALVSLL